MSWQDVNTPNAQSLAHLIATEGIVLLKNDGILPLSKRINNIALIGPWANATTQMQGNYAGVAPFLIGPLQALQTAGFNVTFQTGTAVSTSDTSGFSAALAAVSDAEVVVYVGGIDNSIEAEGNDRTSIVWPGNQLDLISQLASLEKPVVVVQMGGGQVDDSELKSNSSVCMLGIPYYFSMFMGLCPR